MIRRVDIWGQTLQQARIVFGDRPCNRPEDAGIAGSVPILGIAGSVPKAFMEAESLGCRKVVRKVVRIMV